MNQVIRISSWLAALNHETPKTADALAVEAAQVLETKEISPRTIKRIADQLGIKLRRNVAKAATRPGRPKVARVKALTEEVIKLYQAIGADEKTVEAVRARLINN